MGIPKIYVIYNGNAFTLCFSTCFLVILMHGHLFQIRELLEVKKQLIWVGWNFYGVVQLVWTYTKACIETWELGNMCH